MSSGSRGSPEPSVRRELVDFGAEAGLPVRQAAPPGCWSRRPRSSWLCPTGHVSSSTCRSCRQGRGGRCWWGPWASVAFCRAFIPANRAGTLWLRSGAVPRTPQAGRPRFGHAASAERGKRPRCGECVPNSRRSRRSAGWLPEHAIDPQEPFLDSRPASGIDRIGHSTGGGFTTSRRTQDFRSRVGCAAVIHTRLPCPTSRDTPLAGSLMSGGWPQLPLTVLPKIALD